MHFLWLLPLSETSSSLLPHSILKWMLVFLQLSLTFNHCEMGVCCLPNPQYYFKAIVSLLLKQRSLPLGLACHPVLSPSILLFTVTHSTSHHSPSFTWDVDAWTTAAASLTSVPMRTSPITLLGSDDLFPKSTSAPHSSSHTGALYGTVRPLKCEIHPPVRWLLPWLLHS